MSYLPSGTTYPTFVSTFENGVNSGGQDFVANVYSSAAQVTASPNIITSRTFQNFSGASVYFLNSSTPVTAQVFDTFGTAGVSGAAIVISGTSGATINGASTTTISSNWGVKTLVKTTQGGFSGSAWIAY